MSNFIFLRPWWLLALIPLLMLAWFIRKQNANKGWSSVLSPEIAQFLLKEKSQTAQQKILFYPLAIVWSLTVLALSGPSFTYTERPVSSLSQAKIVVLDMSLSMRATDLKPNRLTQMRFKITDLLANNKEGEIALVAYAGDAFVISPLTSDVNTLLNLLPNLSPEIMPSKGSNAEAGINSALELLANAGYQQGQILLVTDGVNDKQVNAINELLADSQHSLSVLAIGTTQGAPITLTNGQLLKDNQGTIVIPQVKAQELIRLASKHNGQFQQLNFGNQEINALFNIDLSSNNTKATELKTTQRNDDGIWLLPIIAFLVAMSFRKQVLFSALIPLLLLQPETSFAQDTNAPTPTSTSIWRNANENGMALFNNQAYQQAADTFNSKHWQASALYKAGEYQQAIDLWSQESTSDAFYNQGNAFAQQGDLNKAKSAYQQALKLSPDNKDAQANLKLIEQLQQQQQNQDKQQEGKNQNEQEQKGKQDKPSEGSQDDQGEQSKKQEQQSSEKQENNENSNDKQSSNKPQDRKDAEGNKEGEQDEPQPNNEDNNTDKKSEQQKQQSTQADADKSEEQSEAPAQQAERTDSPIDEEKQKRLQQWFKQIPDDPSLLLKNKMKLESQKRGNKSQSEQVW